MTKTTQATEREALEAEMEESLKGGYYGNVTFVDCYAGLSLYCAEIADPDDNECGWECAEWSLVDDDLNVTLIARCDGYSGVEWETDEEELLELLGDQEIVDAVLDAVTPYDITGELIAEAKAATLDDVDDDESEPCNIWIEYCYYQGTCNAPNADFLRDDTNVSGDVGHSVTEFDNSEAAQAWIDEREDGTYCLSHGEAGVPSYRIVKA